VVGRRPAERAENISRIVMVDIPGPYKFLYEPAPYKVVYGGRAGTKDWSFARVCIHLMVMYEEKISDINVDRMAKDWCKQIGVSNPGLIIQSLRFPHRILCNREVQESIAASVHALLKEQILILKVEDRFNITEKTIGRRDGGGTFIFSGLRQDTSMHVRSKEGVTIGWSVEAQNITDSSWTDYCPTLRSEGSEKWISFNPDYGETATFKRFVLSPPAGSVVKFLNSFDVEWLKWPQSPNPQCLKDRYVNCPGCPGHPDKIDQQTGYRIKNCGGIRTKYLTMTTLLDRKADYARDPIKAKNSWGGELLGVGMKIYPQFEEKVHVKEFDWKSIKRRANFYMGCDPALNHYPACVWGAKFREGDDFFLWIYDEYPTFADFGEPFCDIRRTVPLTLAIEQLGTIFLEKDGLDKIDRERGMRVRARFIDTRLTEGVAKANAFSSSSEGMVGEFRKQANINFIEPERKKIDIQKDAIIKALSYNKNAPIGATNRPTLYISPRCKNLIMALQCHRMEDRSTRETEKYKDFIDALRIMLAGMSNMTWEDPMKPQNKLEPVVHHGGGDWMGH
jgi:hypothetical protein